MAPPRRHKSAERPLAYLTVNGRMVYLGRWDTRALVAIARERAAIHLGIDREISRRARRWFAQVFHDGIAEKIGYFEDERGAARAHDRVAR